VTRDSESDSELEALKSSHSLTTRNFKLDAPGQAPSDLKVGDETAAAVFFPCRTAVLEWQGDAMCQREENRNHNSSVTVVRAAAERRGRFK